MSKAAPDPFKTQNPQTVYVDLAGRKAICTFQWLLEKSHSHPIHTGNTLRAFIGGEEGFAAIAADIEAARESIDLVCWGFDPGMALLRVRSHPAHPWAMGEPYGELLRRKAGQGVKVRLLVWYSPQGSAKQNSLVGYVNPGEFLLGGVINHTTDELLAMSQAMVGAMSGGIRGHVAAPCRTPPQRCVAAQRLDYCTRWWREATAGQIANLEVRCRDGAPSLVKASVASEADPPQASAGTLGGVVTEKMLIEGNATHHQKPILIDYAHEEGGHAVGYIMGLNSVSDYWDSARHGFEDPLRERDWSGKSDAQAAQALKLKPAEPLSRKPLQDYAFRIEGSALSEVHQNFCRAWNRAALLPKLAAASNAQARAVRSGDLNAELRPPRLARTDAAATQLRLQVLRTQPEESYDDTEQCWPCDKSIKHGYIQATAFARNYLYLENQYFFYEEWARHLKANRQAFTSWVQEAGRTSKDVRTLHLMVVMPVPEDEGMVPRTYDTIKSLGQARSMPNQRQMYEDQEQNEAARQAWDARYDALPWNQRGSALLTLGPRPAGLSAVARDARGVKEPTLNKDGVLMQDGKDLGLKVLICKMATPNQSGRSGLGASRDIYIHSKLLMIDDCYMTAGSANLNLRSMAADSEINVATDHIPTIRALRQRVWGMQTGGDKVGTGGEGIKEEIALAFEHWGRRAAANKFNIDKNRYGMTGFLVQFEDKRTALHRYG